MVLTDSRTVIAKVNLLMNSCPRSEYTLYIYAADQTMGHFTFWISLLLRPKTETKPLSVGLSPNLGLSETLSKRLIQ